MLVCKEAYTWKPYLLDELRCYVCSQQNLFPALKKGDESHIETVAVLTVENPLIHLPGGEKMPHLGAVQGKISPGLENSVRISSLIADYGIQVSGIQPDLCQRYELPFHVLLHNFTHNILSCK